MLGFVGQNEFQVDPKGRVSLPSAYRRGVSGNVFVLFQWQPTHLDLCPEETWMGIQEKLLEFRRTQPDRGAYFRRIVSHAVEVEPDKQGRIRVPSFLRESAGLGGTILLIGAIDRVELWNPERYETAQESGREDDGEFASSIFG